MAVTTRHGGVSAAPYDTLNLGLHVGDDPETVVQNRERAADGLRCRARRRWSSPGRSTAHRAALVGPDDRGRGTRAKTTPSPTPTFSSTTSPEVTLAILVADCVPLALVDPEARVLAAVHAGWRGTAAGAVGRALRAMEDCGARRRPDRAPSSGPAVHPDRYQVSDEVRAGAADAVRPARPRRRAWRGPTAPATGSST